MDVNYEKKFVAQAIKIADTEVILERLSHYMMYNCANLSDREPERTKQLAKISVIRDILIDSVIITRG